eukprot:TRINITY_DN624_c0_g1_i2.p1 TRINITY_DN624_c0_g1~~TRINITY_DN624_c0_g1_i2.p1  ORF type:complete len:680 (+),score=140.73 TRINITY_DN624_c0_g1_i2:35-2074(+)
MEEGLMYRISESRRNEIINKLMEERELRRQLVAQGLPSAETLPDIIAIPERRSYNAEDDDNMDWENIVNKDLSHKKSNVLEELHTASKRLAECLEFSSSKKSKHQRPATTKATRITEPEQPPRSAKAPTSKLNKENFNPSMDTRYLKNIRTKYGRREAPTGKGFSLGKHKSVGGDSDEGQVKLGEVPKEIYGEKDWSKLEVSKEERWQRLLADKREKIREAERQKVEREAAEHKAACTFRPAIGKSPSMSKSVIMDNRRVEERLLAEAADKKRIRELKKIEAETKEQHPFRPKIDRSALKGDAATQPPIYERLGELAKRKQEQLFNLKMASESELAQGFQPKINPNSRVMARTRYDDVDVTQRLLKDAEEKHYKRQKDAEQIEAEIMSSCTFKPAINPSSKLLDNRSELDFEDVGTRHYMEADLRRERQTARLAKLAAEEDCTFRPRINKVSSYLAESDPDRCVEDLAARVDRLSRRDQQRQELTREALEKAIYDKYSFQPTLSQVSQRIGRPTPLTELADGRQVERHREELRKASEFEGMKECSFRPQVNSNPAYRDAKSSYKPDMAMENIEKERQWREQRREEAKRQEEYEELRHCTFQPRTNQYQGEVREEEKIHQVKGVERFMQLKDLKSKQEAEKAQREEQVFHLEKKYDPAKHELYTVPKPFDLSKVRIFNLS